MAGEKRLEPGDEVILNAGIWPGVVEGLLGRGLVPVLVDLDPRTWSMDLAQLPLALSGRTRAVILSHGSTCAPVDQAAAFCVEHGLRLVEFVHSAALAGKYDGKFLGTLGDYGVYSPGRPGNSAWGLALARGESSSALFSRMPSAAADWQAGGAEAGAGAFIPFKAAGPALAASLDTCRTWEAHLPDLEAGFAAYAAFFGAFPGYFTVLEPPAAARLASLHFTLVVKPEAPFTVKELLDADIENKARRWLIEYPADRRRVRQVNALPHTAELGERGVIFPVLREAGARERFFGEFSGWLKKRQD
jgi:dTDP-4-amino-4,6-dideoxygalactose transaminase